MKIIRKLIYNSASGILTMLFVLALNMALSFDANAQDIGQVSFNLSDILVSAKTSNIYFLNKAVDDFKKQDNYLASKLVQILKEEKSPSLNRCASAFYLGEMRRSDSANALAETILLSVDMSKINLMGLPDVLPAMGKYPAMEALVKIGNPSIPAVIRNLAQSDDPNVRELSLQVLTRIDGDKDISQLRLQKALKAETDSQKQMRLQSALKSLSDQK
ncbi:MAG TPA: HEAT repeat domain-containing protein [Verrucomicrobiae bacterium]|jgi:hypothetical protein